MKYTVDRKSKDLKLVNYNVDINGMRVNPINKVNGLTIKVSKITLVDDDLRKSYINQVIGKKTDKIVKFIMQILNEDISDEDDSGMVLDEINRLKGVIMKKYRQYMIEEEYKIALSKLFIVEEEFKKNYNQKVYMNYLSGYSYQEGYSSGRGR
jgi:hypothetical protein